MTNLNDVLPTIALILSVIALIVAIAAALKTYQ